MVGNAVKYAVADSVVHVGASWSGDATTWTFRVTNRCEPIEVDDAARLADPFFRDRPRYASMCIGRDCLARTWLFRTPSFHLSD